MSSPAEAIDWQSKWWDLAKSAREAQINYGRWIVNTLWLMHSGAIVGFLSKWDGKSTIPNKAAVSCFVAGIVFAFATASIAWFNFTISDDIFRRFTYAGEKWDSTDVSKHWDWLKRTMYAAIGCVLISIMCLIFGAALIISS